MKNNYKGFYIISLILLVIAFLIPIIVNQCFIHLTIRSAFDLGNKEWLSFCGSYLGGIIGAFATLIALFATYKQNEIQHKSTRDEMREQKRLQVLPAVSVSIKDASYSEIERSVVYYLDLETEEFGMGNIKDLSFFCNPEVKEYSSHFQLFTIRNIGVAALLGANLLYKESKRDIKGIGFLGALQKGEEIKVYFLFPDEPKYMKYNFAIKFFDIYGNAYEQFFSYSFRPCSEGHKTNIRAQTTSSPKLISKENWGQFDP